MPTATPWAHARNEDEFAVPVSPVMESHYAVPSPEDAGAPYSGFGWAPSLRLSPATIPDTSRLGTTPRHDYRPDPTRPPEEFWNRTGEADRRVRYDESEHQEAVGWAETKVRPGDMSPGISVYARWAPNPRSTPPPEPRVTQQLSPANYSYTRPFDQLNRGNAQDGLMGSARHLSGQHFSMADHRREYPILGMAPQRARRNTYRIEPAPWDADIVDMPEQPHVTEARVMSPDVEYTSRSWRL